MSEVERGKEERVFIVGVTKGKPIYKNFERTVLNGLDKERICSFWEDKKVCEDCCGSDKCYLWGVRPNIKSKPEKGDYLLFYVADRETQSTFKKDGEVYLGRVCSAFEISEADAEKLKNIWDDGEKYRYLLFLEQEPKKLKEPISEVNKILGFESEKYFPFFSPVRKNINLEQLESLIEDLEENRTGSSDEEIHTFDEEIHTLEGELARKRQVILYGPPGTGKTYLARKYVIKSTGESKPGKLWDFVTFHQSYSYEEFIEGFKPKLDGQGNITYAIEDGIFKRLTIYAIASAIGEDINTASYDSLKKKVIEFFKKPEPVDFSKAPRFYLLIDEINRGNISKIFGELMTLLERDKRLGEENQLIVKLPYSNEPFGVPPNLFVIGTMNTADRSIALLDVALRRRFSFIEVGPRDEFLEEKNITHNSDSINLASLLRSINDRIEVVKGRDYLIGHSYFLAVEEITDLYNIWYKEIIPLLLEYFYGDWSTIKRLLNETDGSSDPSFFKRLAIEGPNGEETYRLRYLDVGDFFKAIKKIVES